MQLVLIIYCFICNGPARYVPVEFAGCNEVRVQLNANMGVKRTTPILVTKGTESKQVARCELESGQRLGY